MTDRSGWSVTHPLTGKQVHVVTREWFDELSDQFRAADETLYEAILYETLCDIAARLETAKELSDNLSVLALVDSLLPRVQKAIEKCERSE